MKNRVLLISLAVMLALSVGLIGCTAEVPEITQYNLTIVSTEGGEITVPGDGTFSYEQGTVVPLVAFPHTGYRFLSWTGDVGAVDDVNVASTTITINDNYSITANFMTQYTLTIDSTDGGEVTSPGEGRFTYDAGTVVELVAEAEEGCKFLNWSGDVDTVTNVTAALTAISIDDDYVVTGNFTLSYTYFDMIGPGPWGLHIIGGGVNATVTKAGLAVDFASDPEDDPEAKPNPVFAADGYSAYLLEGDFDIRMPYELTIWPPQSGVRVGLSIGIPNIPDMFVNVERVGAGPPESWLDNREVYLVNWNNSIPVIITTDDLSGTLRIRREGGMVSCYYRTPEGWHELYRAECSIEDVGALAHPWSHEHLFGGKEVSVLMRTVEIVEPAPQSIRAV